MNEMIKYVKMLVLKHKIRKEWRIVRRSVDTLSDLPDDVFTPGRSSKLIMMYLSADREPTIYNVATLIRDLDALDSYVCKHYQGNYTYWSMSYSKSIQKIHDLYISLLECIELR